MRSYHETKMKEHQRILGRFKIVEERKKYIEHISTVCGEKEMRRLEELLRPQMLAEQKRLEHEREERERKRQQSEIQQIKERYLKEKMQQISKISHGQKVLKKLDEDEIKKLDVEQIAAREAEEIPKARRDMQQKLKSQEKKIHYLEHAKRLEEIPLLEKAVKEKMELAKQRWVQWETKRVAAAVEERQQAVATHESMARMKEDHDIILAKILAESKSIYLEKLKEFEKVLNEERASRLLKRKVERKAERKAKWEKERTEVLEGRRLEELRIKRGKEKRRIEEERTKTEEEERLKRAEEEAKGAERLAKIEKQAEITRAREAEIERKLEERRQRDKEISDTWRRGGDSHIQMSWRRNMDIKVEGGKEDATRWKRRDTDKWRKYDHKGRKKDTIERWRKDDNKERKKDTLEKWRKDDYDKDDVRDRDRIVDKDRGMDERPPMRHIPRDPLPDGPRSRGRMSDWQGGHRRGGMMHNTGSQNWREKNEVLQNAPRELLRREEK